LERVKARPDAAPWFIRRRTSRFPAASSALRIRTFCSRTCGHHEPGLSLLSIGNNTRGKHLWKWLRQIVLVAWALPVECEHRTTSRQTQSANLGIYSLRLFRKERGRVVEIFIARQDRFLGSSPAESSSSIPDNVPHCAGYSDSSAAIASFGGHIALGMTRSCKQLSRHQYRNPTKRS
jgi:hypothetical protein